MTKGGESPDEAGLEHQVAALPCNSDRGSRHTTCEQRQAITRCATVRVDPVHHIVLQRPLLPVAQRTRAVDTRTGPNRVHGRGTEMSILASVLETTAPSSTETSVLADPGRSPGRRRLPVGIRLTPVVRNFMVPPLRRLAQAWGAPLVVRDRGLSRVNSRLVRGLDQVQLETSRHDDLRKAAPSRGPRPMCVISSVGIFPFPHLVDRSRADSASPRAAVCF